MHGPIDRTTPKTYRAIFISDVHLGTRGCKATYLLDFLRHNEAEWIYLVGDIVDAWRLKRSWYWPQSHNDIVQTLLRKAHAGTKVIYVPGNHDELLRGYLGLSFGQVKLLREAVHVTADGRRLLVLHGDKFDTVVRHAHRLALLGDWAYNLCLVLNTWLNIARRRLGFGYWSLSAYLKNKVKNAVNYIDNFELTVAEEARRRRIDGVVCGHIHKAEIRDLDGILYCNDGDWVESCTAMVEHMDGRLEIVHWAEVRNLDLLDAAA